MYFIHLFYTQKPAPLSSQNGGICSERRTDV